MRMSQATYDTLLDEFRTIIAKMEESGCDKAWSRPVDLDAISMRDMWDFVLVSNIDRSNPDHPRHHTPGMLPRALEFTDRDLHWLYNQENLDDGHIETALRRMMVTLQEERHARMATAPAL